MRDAADEQGAPDAVAVDDGAADEPADDGGAQAEDLGDGGDLLFGETHLHVERVGHDPEIGVAQLVEHDEQEDEHPAVAPHELGEGSDDGAIQPPGGGGQPGRRSAGLGGGRLPGLGAEEDGRHPDQNEPRHHGVDLRPTEHVGQRDGPGAGRQHAEAVTVDDHGGTGALLAFLENLDAVGIDDDVLAGRGEGDDDRE